MKFHLLISVFLVVGCTDNEDTHENVITSALAPGPDLVVTNTVDPPACAVLNQTFSLTETVQNVGDMTAGASFTKFYLSANGTTPQYWMGARAVPSLDASMTDTGTITGVVAGGTPSGLYRLLACADRGPGNAGGFSQVPESNENNNCRASVNAVFVTGPDLVTSNVSSSPASINPLTGTLTVTDTVTNQGNAPAGSSITRWYLSTDRVRNAGDAFIRNCNDGGPIPGRNIPARTNGASHTGSSSTSPLCVRDAAGLHPPAPGVYYVISCADETSQVVETVETLTSQCSAATNTLTVL